MNVAATAHWSAERKSGFADVDGARIAYEVHGQLGSATTPLLILHGSLMSGAAMAPLVDQFAADRPVITIDARGHGRTGDLPGPITYERLADDAAAVLRTLGVGSADVLGYSMGGTTAVVMAARHPAQVSKLVILSGVAARSGWQPEAQAGFEQWRPEMFAGTPVEAAYKRLSATPDAFPAVIDKLRALETADYDIAPARLRAIPAKTMIIAGDADGVDLAQTLQLFAARGGKNTEAATKGFMSTAPRARLAILPASSHVQMMSQAPLIAQLVMPFLNDRAPPPPTGFFEGMAK